MTPMCTHAPPPGARRVNAASPHVPTVDLTHDSCSPQDGWPLAGCLVSVTGFRGSERTRVTELLRRGGATVRNGEQGRLPCMAKACRV